MAAATKAFDAAIKIQKEFFDFYNWGQRKRHPHMMRPRLIKIS